MRTWRGSARLAFLLAALGNCVALPARAQAQLWVAATSDEPAAVEHAELAYALGEQGAATWLSLRVRRGPVAVVAALGDGGRAGAAVDAWFSALEDSLSPSVVAPVGSPDCGAIRPFSRVSWSRSRGALPTELRLDTPADVAAALDAEGLEPLADLPESASFVLWVWPDQAGVFTTRTLRLEGGRSPFALAPGWDFPVSVSALGNGPLLWPSEVDKRELSVTFVGGERPTSDYREKLSELLLEGTPIVEARARGPLFDWSIYGDVVSVAPLVKSFADEAGSELGDIDAGACREQLAALREVGAPAPSACGAASDAGLALALVDPERATLQRFQLRSRYGVQPSSLMAGGEPSTPVLRARLFDGTACASEPLPPIVGDPDGPTVVDAPQRQPPVVVEETVIVEEHPVEVDCGGHPGPSYERDDGAYYDDDESCASDTSSSSDTTSDDGCASDSSGSSETGGEVDCASDSSGSQSDSDAGCGSDSSSSSDSSSDGCSGDTTTSSEDGGYDGDTCTSSVAARAGRPRPQRLKLSAWALGLALLVLPIRRRKRRVGPGG